MNQRPQVKLIGEDGNAFNILGICRQAAKRAKWTDEQWAEFEAQATDGDYNRLLQVVMEHFEVE
jgi:hypothetical protein